MARLANCWIVAMWLWLAGGMRGYAWIRRSFAFRRMLPHFGTGEAIGWRHVRIVEYVPPKSRLWSRENVLVLFRGEYRVWHLRAVSVRRYDSMAAALADIYWKGKVGNDVL